MSDSGSLKLSFADKSCVSQKHCLVRGLHTVMSCERQSIVFLSLSTLQQKIILSTQAELIVVMHDISEETVNVLFFFYKAAHFSSVCAVTVERIGKSTFTVQGPKVSRIIGLASYTCK